MRLLNSAAVPSVLPGHILKAKGLRKAWKMSQLMAQDIFHSRQHLYLPTLIPRKKWNCPQVNFKVGDLVLLRDYNMVKNQWSRGRVNKVILDKDGRIRCLEVRKPDGTVLLRDVRNICRLEVDLKE